MNVDQATREVLWNISYAWLMYVLLVPTLIIAGYGVWRRARKWHIEKWPTRCNQPWRRIKRTFVQVVLQNSSWRDRYFFAFHGMLFWGFLVLVVATTVVMLEHDFGLSLMHGRFYLYFQSLLVDCMGVAATLGVGALACRRWFNRPSRLVYSAESTGLLWLIFIILVTGFLLEGWRIAGTNDEWAAWSPFGWMVAKLSLSITDVETIQRLHFGFWWFHLVLVFGFIAWAPYTKMMHLLAGPVNIFLSDLDSRLVKLEPIEFESATSFGINSLEQFHWKDLFELDACTECGRCSNVCPANQSGKELSPRNVILDLQAIFRSHDISQTTPSRAGEEYEPAIPVIGTSDALSPNPLWQCTTCGACVETCPVEIGQLPKILEMRRFMAMEQGDVPQQMQEALSSIEDRGHPMRGSQFSRVDWMGDLKIPTIEETDEAEILLWVGCGGAFVERNHSIVRATAKLLQMANVKFAVLGQNECCTGDPARRMGNEFLFDSIAKQNGETFQRLGIKNVVTTCPHCFNSLKNEYPDFGVELEVVHHTTYFAQLIGSGRLPVNSTSDRKIAFHDPCYLGRHNGITKSPREILQHTTSESLREMSQKGQQSFCCGAGGGMSFVEEPSDKRVNRLRAQQALETDADTIAVACPFCSTMMEDGINAEKEDRQVVVKDVAELLWESMDSDPHAETEPES